jgi:tRNA(adenine34) deaminase
VEVEPRFFETEKGSTFSQTDRAFMDQALDLAGQAQAMGEVPVGAVVVYQGRVIGQGHNRTITDQDPTAHAEVLALRAAARHQKNYRLPGCWLFSTLEPCAMCAGAIFHARLDRVVFAAADFKTGVAGSVTDLFTISSLNHHARVEKGLCQAQAVEQLQDFFRRRRQVIKSMSGGSLAAFLSTRARA